MDVIKATCNVSVEEELSKNPKINREMIQSLQDWAQKQPHLPPLLDIQLLNFLVVSGNSSERAKKLIDVHFTMKTHFKDLFSDRDLLSPALQDAMDTVYITRLKGVDFEGRRVNFTSLRTPDPSRYHGPTTTKLIYMFEDLMLLRQGSHAPGVTVVMDATGFGMSHLSTISLSFLKQSSTYFTQGANVIVNSIIVVNANPVAEKLVMLMRPFVPPEIFKRIHVLSREKGDKLFEFMSRDIVPCDLGGTGESIATLTKETYQVLLDNREFYLAEESAQRVNEARRPSGGSGGAIRSSVLEGSFKKLDLD